MCVCACVCVCVCVCVSFRVIFGVRSDLFIELYLGSIVFITLRWLGYYYFLSQPRCRAHLGADRSICHQTEFQDAIPILFFFFSSFLHPFLLFFIPFFFSSSPLSLLFLFVVDITVFFSKMLLVGIELQWNLKAPDPLTQGV